MLNCATVIASYLHGLWMSPIMSQTRMLLYAYITSRVHNIRERGLSIYYELLIDTINFLFTLTCMKVFHISNYS